MARALGPVLGVRRLATISGRRPVTVTLGTPRRMRDHVDWQCPFRLTGLRHTVVEHGYGVDAIQALTNALEGIRVTLRDRGPRVSWLEPSDAGGFDRMVPLLFGPAFVKRVNRAIDREFAAFTRAMARRHRRRAGARRRRSR
jgi:hypothetical protein